MTALAAIKCALALSNAHSPLLSPRAAVAVPQCFPHLLYLNRYKGWGSK